MVLGLSIAPVNREEAQRELNLAAAINPALNSTRDDLQNNETSAQQELFYWSNVNNLYPQYRYATKRLIEILYTQGKGEAAREKLEEYKKMYPYDHELDNLSQEVSN